MELFCGNSWQLKFLNYFRKNCHRRYLTEFWICLLIRGVVWKKLSFDHLQPFINHIFRFQKSKILYVTVLPSTWLSWTLWWVFYWDILHCRCGKQKTWFWTTGSVMQDAQSFDWDQYYMELNTLFSPPFQSVEDLQYAQRKIFFG